MPEWPSGADRKPGSNSHHHTDMPASLNHIHSNTPMGANLVDGGATFRVWAPNATSIFVRGSFNGFTDQSDAALVRGENGYWHGFIPGVKDRDTYKYWITGPAGPGREGEPSVRGCVWPTVGCGV